MPLLNSGICMVLTPEMSQNNGAEFEVDVIAIDDQFDQQQLPTLNINVQSGYLLQFLSPLTRSADLDIV